MTIQSWERVKELLHEAMQLTSAQRALFLDQACSSDRELRAEVESLLLADEAVRSGFLQSVPSAGERGRNDAGADVAPSASGRDRVDSITTLDAGQVFAQRFQLVRKLGEGGMGQVWLAEQTSPVRRQVALKLIKAGMYDESVVQRFQSERQSLAIMDHPAIAKVFDAGATPQGQPYFVMEYVPGLPITDYCDQKKLKIRDRLQLFIQACEGVQHAHQKAIIHRDLKPANILVVEIDGKPRPRIIDFGLAKAITPHADDESVFTQLGHFVGTPGYMSPEQADPGATDRATDIDTRTDVYSLGVVLYVLLTGAQPFDTKQWKNQPLLEWLRMLREEEPPSPSAKVSAESDTATTAAQARGTEPRPLVNLLRGDLDWITMKALEKDRTRRYGAPSELAADIRRYLNHEPVLARPASAGYKLKKYVRRHRIGVGAACGLALLLAAFALVQAREFRRITRERDRANRITDFMTGMFKVSDPSEARGNSITAREILDKASNDMEKGLASDPEVQSQMMQVMAGTYFNLGLYPRAHELAKSALDARRNLLGSDNPKTLESTAQLGEVLDRQGNFAEAEKLESQALEGERRVLGPYDPLTVEAMVKLAHIMENQGRYKDEEKLMRDAIQTETGKLNNESPQMLSAMEHLGNALFYQARYAEAEEVYRQNLADWTRANGSDSPEALTVMGDLAWDILNQDRLAEAEAMFRDALARYRHVFGPEHPDTAAVMDGLAHALVKEGRLPEAETLCRQSLAIWSHDTGPESADTLISKHYLAMLLFEEGHIHESEKMVRETVDTESRLYGPSGLRAANTKDVLARVLIREGNYQEAEKVARESLEVHLRELGPLHPNTLVSLKRLGQALACSNRYAEASRMFRDVIAKQDASREQENAYKVWYAFAAVAVAGNHSDDAIQYLQEAIHRGYKDANGLMADDDLKKLQPSPKFQQLVASLKTPTQKN